VLDKLRMQKAMALQIKVISAASSTAEGENSQLLPHVGCF